MAPKLMIKKKYTYLNSISIDFGRFPFDRIKCAIFYSFRIKKQISELFCTLQPQVQFPRIHVDSLSMVELFLDKFYSESTTLRVLFF